jgi:hypothetical protein
MARSMRLGKFSGGTSRMGLRSAQNLGIISTENRNKMRKFRDKDLDLLDQYYENRQYDNLPEWDEAADMDEYIPIRKRKPRIIYALPKVLVDKVAAKLVGNSVFPQFTIEDDPDATAFFKAVQDMVGFKANIMEPTKRLLASGSVFVRFYLVEGSMQMEWYNSKYCYPVFDGTGELAQLDVKWVYEDQNDKDQKGNPKKKWYRLSLTQISDILFDNPEYVEGAEPDFKVVEQNDHNLGWVQGEWLRTGKDKFKYDGPSLYADIMDFCDEMNYSLSQTSQAVGYNQEPQLGLNGMDEDEIDKLIRSSQKAWNLGKDGKAAFIESSMEGVKEAEAQRIAGRNKMLDVARVVIHDPEKIVGQASSGKALEILHAPLVELIDELRLMIEPALKNLLIKMGMTLIAMERQGLETALEMPAGYVPSSLNFSVLWPHLFPLTIEDLQKKVTAGAQAANAHILSRETITRWLAKDFGVEDIEEELKKIQGDVELMMAENPFGGGKSF